MAGTGPRDDDEGIITEINVTPMVDITLVLLIIFMVTAGFIVNPAIKIELPKAASGESVERSTLAVSLSKGGDMFLNGQKVDEKTLAEAVRTAVAKNAKVQAVVAADRSVPHGDVVRIIDLIKRLGVAKFAISIDRGG
jgi:biopolymer transport protein TolR